MLKNNGLMGYFMKVKGGILLYALVISLISAIISLSILSYFFMSSSITRASILNRKIQNTLEASTLIGLKMDGIVLKQIKVFSSEATMATIDKNYWGVYTLLISTVQFDNKNYRKSVLCGRKVDRDNIPAIYLQDYGNSITIMNNCKLEGPVYFPKSGYKVFSSFSNKKSNLDELDLHESSTSLPSCDPNVLSYLNELINFNKVNQYIKFNGGLDSVIFSFNDSTRIFDSQEEIKLENCFVEGNIIIRSAKKVEIFESAKLKNIIIVAPEIVVNSGFKGAIQCISENKITLEEDCKLVYPSSIVLLPDFTRNKYSVIQLSRNDSIAGSIICISVGSTGKFEPRINMDESCFVKGLIYSNNEINFSGTLVGSLYAGTIIYEDLNTRNSDFLSNANINVKKLNKDFLFGNLIGLGKTETLTTLN